MVVPRLTPWLLVGIAVDGPGKSMDKDSNNNNICLIKQKGKVKALDEELYSKTQLLLLSTTCS